MAQSLLMIKAVIKDIFKFKKKNQETGSHIIPSAPLELCLVSIVVIETSKRSSAASNERDSSRWAPAVIG